MINNRNNSHLISWGEPSVLAHASQFPPHRQSTLSNLWNFLSRPMTLPRLSHPRTSSSWTPPSLPFCSRGPTPNQRISDRFPICSAPLPLYYTSAKLSQSVLPFSLLWNLLGLSTNVTRCLLSSFRGSLSSLPTLALLSAPLALPSLWSYFSFPILYILSNILSILLSVVRLCSWLWLKGQG